MKYICEGGDYPLYKVHKFNGVTYATMDVDVLEKVGIRIQFTRIKRAEMLASAIPCTPTPHSEVYRLNPTRLAKIKDKKEPDAEMTCPQCESIDACAMTCGRYECCGCGVIYNADNSLGFTIQRDMEILETFKGEFNEMIIARDPKTKKRYVSHRDRFGEYTGMEYPEEANDDY